MAVHGPPGHAPRRARQGAPPVDTTGGRPPACAGATRCPDCRCAAHGVEARAPAPTLAQLLLRAGLIGSERLLRALALRQRLGGGLDGVLRSHAMIDETVLLEVMARRSGTSCIDPARHPPDPRLVDALGVERCLRLRCLPWRRAGDVCVVATPHAEAFADHRPELERHLGPVVMALVGADALDTAVAQVRGAAMRRRAESCVPEAESCRDWSVRGASRALGIGLGLVVLAAWLAPLAVLWGLTALATFSLVAAGVLKLGAALAVHGRANATAAAPISTPPQPPGDVGTVASAPDVPSVISILVPMLHETDTLPRLIGRLSRLSYPRTHLDVLLVVEETDTATRAALAALALPGWMRVIVVPDAPLRTKPRALNYALNFARGTIIGVYDAEDAPEPDQLQRVAARLAAAGPDLACVQGMLDYFNPETNWLSRCFTIEYATWFRLLLPGKERLGLVLPLGGTTLFFRRAALERLGGWDAHNVTEDADLGIRLARHGYRTEVIGTTTFEEANCHALPWVRQRSRWLKGYAVTWMVHMRDPRALWRQLGPRRFLGLQVQFLGTLVQVLLAPVLLSFWALFLGLGHPLAMTAPDRVFLTLAGLFVTSLAIDLACAWLALASPHHRGLRRWIVTMPLYFPLATLAGYKALWELVVAPHYWDKTAHGAYGTHLDRAIVVSD